MGLFSNNKKLCPVCGNATPRLLATKIEGTPICSDCADKIDMRAERRNNLTLDEFESYLAFFEGNAPLKAQFREDYKKTAGFFSSKAFLCDYEHKLFKLSTQNNAIVYEPQHFVKLTVTQDERTVIELTKDNLRIYDTGVEAAIEAQQPAIDQYNALHNLTGNIRRMALERDRREGRIDDTTYRNELRDLNYDVSNDTPDFDCPVPFNKWHISVEVDHPWGEGVSDSDGQVWFDNKKPSVYETIDKYRNSLAQYKELAMAFCKACCPDCKIVEDGVTAVNPTTGTAAAGSLSNGAMDDIMKYKSLLDSGVITQEEFDVKKKELLNL